MLLLAIEFTSRDAQEIRFVVNTERETAFHPGDATFDLTTDHTEAHVFYTHEEMLEVRNSIVRVLNRRGYDGGEFNENREHTKDVVRQIRSYLNMRGNRFDIQFSVYRLVPEKMGNVAFSIRSDALS